MIISSIDDLKDYRCMSKNMSLAIDYLQELDLQTMQDGKYPVVGEDVFAIVSSYQTRKHTESLYETHQNYIDIQCLISGDELIFCSDASKLEPSAPYNPQTDKQNYKDAAGEVCIRLLPGTAAVFYPQDAHKASCISSGIAGTTETAQLVTKLLLKVKI